METMTLQRTVLGTEEIAEMVERVAAEINDATAHVDRPVFVGVMKGAYIWMADLLRAVGRYGERDFQPFCVQIISFILVQMHQQKA